MKRMKIKDLMVQNPQALIRLLKRNLANNMETAFLRRRKMERK